MENPERIWLLLPCDRSSCMHIGFLSARHPCFGCGKLPTAYIRADLVPPEPRPSDEPLRDAAPR